MYFFSFFFGHTYFSQLALSFNVNKSKSINFISLNGYLNLKHPVCVKARSTLVLPIEGRGGGREPFSSEHTKATLVENRNEMKREDFLAFEGKLMRTPQPDNLTIHRIYHRLSLQIFSILCKLREVH